MNNQWNSRYYLGSCNLSHKYLNHHQYGNGNIASVWCILIHAKCKTRVAGSVPFRNLCLYSVCMVFCLPERDEVNFVYRFGFNVIVHAPAPIQFQMFVTTEKKTLAICTRGRASLRLPLPLVNTIIFCLQVALLVIFVSTSCDVFFLWLFQWAKLHELSLIGFMDPTNGIVCSVNCLCLTF